MSEPCSTIKRFSHICSTIYPGEIGRAVISNLETFASEDFQIVYSPHWSPHQKEAFLDFLETIKSVLLPRIDRFATEGRLNITTPATLDALRAVVIHKCEAYLASFPGKDKLPSNRSVHWHIDWLMDQSVPFALERLASLDTKVEYRLQSMQAADIYVSVLGLTTPYGVTCARWDGTAPHAARQRGSPEEHARILRALKQSDLFPKPETEQGALFPKPLAYLATAIQISDVDEETLPTALQELLAAKNEAISAKVEALSRLETVKEAARLYFSASCKPRAVLHPSPRITPHKQPQPKISKAEMISWVLGSIG
ncbi:MAG: hypothetical protein LQ346_006666 [Caloplaca aetnensis]|nr:MAG: hypothetical protein LQ346_006666 [Caloplaca aetnensis]